MILNGTLVKLRALEPEDIEPLMAWENNPEFWHLSTTLAPFSRYALKQYIQLARHDIYTAKQLRLMVVSNHNYTPVGTIDLYDYDPFHRRAGIGILIAAQEDRNKGFGKDALDTLLRYCKEALQLHQVYAQIGSTNSASKSLFEGAGFECTGVRKAWRNQGNGNFEDELFYQHLFVQ